jgi:hypothetical protein|tara:strand:+ start:750 stop:1049 length:300 start_codon:yes stop_codon:yes gene_type:complete
MSLYTNPNAALHVLHAIRDSLKTLRTERKEGRKNGKFAKKSSWDTPIEALEKDEARAVKAFQRACNHKRQADKRARRKAFNEKNLTYSMRDVFMDAGIA